MNVSRDIRATAPLDYMKPEQRMRMRRAANHALRLYPGPVGTLVFRELLAWEEMGWRLGPGVIMKVVDHILEQVEVAA